MKLSKIALTPSVVAISVALCAAVSALRADAGTKAFTLTVANDAVLEPQTDMPVLVRLSTEISGFSYADFALPEGGDLQFTDSAGNVIPHEVDIWNKEGESLVWVKLPTCANGTQFKCLYGSGNPSPASATDVWSDYFAVFHMNGETAGSEMDSTVHAITLTPSGNDLSKMESIDAQVGKGRVVDTATGTADASLNGFSVTGLPAGMVNGDGQLTFSCWFYNDVKSKSSYYPPLFKYMTSANSVRAMSSMRNGNTSIQMQGASTSTGATGYTKLTNKTWQHVTIVFDGEKVSAYTNGGKDMPGQADFETDRTKTSGLRAPADAGQGGVMQVMYEFNGKADEIRFCPAALSGSRVAADYATQTRTDFLTAGAVVDVVFPVLEAPVFAVTDEGKMSVVVTLTEGAGALVLEYANGENVTRVDKGNVTAPVTVTDVPELEPDAVYSVVAEVTSASGVVVRRASERTFLNGEVSVSKNADATYPEVGSFAVTRPSSAGAVIEALTLGYQVETALVPDGDFAALSGSVTIPAGESTATVVVTPLDNHMCPRSGELKLMLAGGDFLPSVNTSAVMTVTTSPLPMPTAGGTVTFDGVQYADPVNYRPTGSDYTVILTNAAVFNAKGNAAGLGMTDSDHATIVVTDRSVVTNTSSVTLFNTKTTDSTFIVSDGGNLIWGRNQGELALNGERNTLIVTNAFLEMPLLADLGIKDSDRAHVRLYGVGNRYFEVGDETIVNYAGLSFKGDDASVLIGGGQNVNTDFNTNSLQFDDNTAGNIYRQVNGTVRDFLRLLFKSTSARNRVELSEGSMLKIDRMDDDGIRGSHNRIVIDNATLTMGRSNALALFGTAGNASDFRVELKGDTPLLAFAGQTAIGNVDAERIHFVFTPPAEGYETAPVTFGAECVTNHYDIAVNIAAFPEGVKRIPLFAFGNATELDVSDIPVVSAPLKDCLLVKIDNTLYLRRPKQGLSVIVR